MKEYTVILGGIEHTMQLSEEEAKLRGAVPVAKSAPAPANKARDAKNK